MERVPEAFLYALEDALRDALRVDFPRALVRPFEAPVEIPIVRMQSPADRVWEFVHDSKIAGAVNVPGHCFLVVEEKVARVRASFTAYVKSKVTRRAEPSTLKIVLKTRKYDFERGKWVGGPEKALGYDPGIDELPRPKTRFSLVLDVEPYFNLVRLVAEPLCARTGRFYRYCMAVITSLLKLNVGVYIPHYEADARLPAQAPAKAVRFVGDGTVPTRPWGTIAVPFEIGGWIVTLARYIPAARAIVDMLRRNMPKIIAEVIRSRGVRVKAQKYTSSSIGIYTQHILSLPLIGTPWAR